MPFIIQLTSYEKLEIVEPRVVGGSHSALQRCVELCPSTHQRQPPSADLVSLSYCTKYFRLALYLQIVLTHETLLEVLCPKL